MFIGRKKELQLLKSKFDSNNFEFGIIHGRRRVGKTTLLTEAIKNRKALYFVAKQANIAMNLELFSAEYGKYKELGNLSYGSFYDLFTNLFQEKDLIIIIDEFTYLTEIDKSIESILQELIDKNRHSSNIKLLISGSEVGMFENLFASSRPLFNRQTFSLKLHECDYLESSLYYPNFSNEDKIIAYSIFGGLPYYLSLINDQLSIKDNVMILIANPQGRLKDEPALLLHSELRSINQYQSVLQAIYSGSTKLSVIDSKALINKTSTTIKYINKLIDLELVEKNKRFLDGPNSRNYLYRIKNNFFAFYFTFIWKNESSLMSTSPEDFYTYFIEQKLNEYVSTRFEDICMQYLLKNFKSIYNEPLLDIGSYWYNDPLLRENIEIDIVTKSPSGIFVYECKWSTSKVGKSVLDNLIPKSQKLNAVKSGLFSKTGFTDNIDDNTTKITLDDLFKET